jgi:hypothetical protein
MKAHSLIHEAWELVEEVDMMSDKKLYNNMKAHQKDHDDMYNKMRLL